MSLTPGTRLGAYEVLASIGQGGMGEVYRARDTSLGREVAIKVLPDQFADDVDTALQILTDGLTKLYMTPAAEVPDIPHVVD